MKVKFSNLIAGMSGKLNGGVAARNRGGAYFRIKVTPTNPQTIAQVEARNRLAQFSQAWRSLTQAQRDAWAGAVDQWKKTDVFGDAITPSGSNLFVRLNINITNAGGTSINLPPIPVGATALSSLEATASAAAAEIQLDFAPGVIPVGTAMVVEATPALSAGISNAKSRFRQITVLAAGTAAGEDIGAAWVAKFGTLVVGQKVFIRARLVTLTTGEVSQSLVTSVIVAA